MFYTVIDFETTGLDHTQEQVIEIGAIKLDENFKEVARLHTMVNLSDGKELRPFITELTGITEHDTLSGVPEVVGLTMLKDFIGDSVVVAQHAPFDLAFLEKAHKPKRFIDTRSLSRLINPHEKAGLKDICLRYGVKLEGHHRSINDCEATAEVLEIMIDILEGTIDTYMNVIIETPDRKLTYIPSSAIVI